MAWIYLFIAGLLEVVWAYFLKESNGFSRLAPSAVTIATMIASFGLLSMSMRTLPSEPRTPYGRESVLSAPLPWASLRMGRQWAQREWPQLRSSSPDW
jgi:hypothetical protein